MDDDGDPLSYGVDAIIAGAQDLLRQLELRLRTLRAVFQAVDRFDAVSGVIRPGECAAAALPPPMDLLDIGEVRARVVVNAQLLQLEGKEHGQLAEEYGVTLAEVADLESLLASPMRQRELVGTERGNYLARHDLRFKR